MVYPCYLLPRQLTRTCESHSLSVCAPAPPPSPPPPPPLPLGWEQSDKLASHSPSHGKVPSSLAREGTGTPSSSTHQQWPRCMPLEERHWWIGGKKRGERYIIEQRLKPHRLVCFNLTMHHTEGWWGLNEQKSCPYSPAFSCRSPGCHSWVYRCRGQTGRLSAQGPSTRCWAACGRAPESSNAEERFREETYAFPAATQTTGQAEILPACQSEPQSFSAAASQLEASKHMSTNHRQILYIVI